MHRVEQAKESRSIYWPVPTKGKTTPPEESNTGNAKTHREPRGPRTQTATQPTTEKQPEKTSSTRLDTNRRRSLQEEMDSEVRAPIDTITIPSPSAISNEEIWETPVMQQETPQPFDLAIDPQLLTMQEQPPLAASRG